MEFVEVLAEENEIVCLPGSCLVGNEQGLDELFNTLLGMKTDGVMVRIVSDRQFTLRGLKIPLRFLHPFPNDVVHKEPCHDPWLL